MSTETVTVKLSTDEHGYVGKECPEPECLGYFKVTPGTGLKGSDLPCHCPYCGYTGSHKRFYTPEQIAYAKSVVVRQFSDKLVATLKKMEFDHKPRGAFGIGMSLKVQPGERPPIQQYRERKLETEIVCKNCDLHYAVYGVFGFCPDCRQHNSLQILESNLAIVGKMLDMAEQADRDLAEKLVENALEDCVSAFDGFGRELCRLHTTRHPEGRLDRWTFQNLETVRSNIRDNFGTDIAALVLDDEWKEALIAFQKRHLVSHKMGVVDQSYIEKTGDSRHAVGRKIEITAVEVRDLSRTLKMLAEDIAKIILPRN
ncbi:MAG: hypothetical protein QOJ15_11142 [Bradyrhizobium sp.]|jgi:hypothetical protein|nr:hypothetical protein [Bradyrhizobium sp.]